MKYKARYFKPAEMNTEDHFMLGTIWPITGSKGNSYDVELNPQGFNCSCPGFGFHGKCKHVKSVADTFLCEDVPKYAI